jgi:transposase-like protein
MERLIVFKENWGTKYPAAIRKIIYTTNIIEGLNRQFRKVTKTKSSFPNDDSLRKILYLASKTIVKKWAMRYRDWDMVWNHLIILFENRYAI